MMTTLSKSPVQARSTTVDLALVASLAALVAVCSILPAINVSTFAPITLQTFGVLLAGAVLGARRGVLAVLLWMAVGAIGMPVFAGGKAGLGVFAGPTGGYLVGMVLAVATCGLLVERLARRGRATQPVLVAAAGIPALVVLHVLGIVGLHLRADLSWSAAGAVDVVFVPGDLVKLVATALVAAAVHRAFPALLRRGA
ncbi:biotin transporter BioY [Janibacter melonis]|uniref:biotin transporter BioY n=1 Tax=Janibacter melonis TaxID=262209 RepID=UPI00174C0990|nr:biotin transporter BioY [Janibacter melonis]